MVRSTGCTEIRAAARVTRAKEFDKANVMAASTLAGEPLSGYPRRQRAGKAAIPRAREERREERDRQIIAG